jgi:hypothetical protein
MCGRLIRILVIFWVAPRKILDILANPLNFKTLSSITAISRYFRQLCEYPKSEILFLMKSWNSNGILEVCVQSIYRVRLSSITANPTHKQWRTNRHSTQRSREPFHNDRKRRIPPQTKTGNSSMRGIWLARSTVLLDRRLTCHYASAELRQRPRTKLDSWFLSPSIAKDSRNETTAVRKCLAWSVGRLPQTAMRTYREQLD